MLFRVLPNIVLVTSSALWRRIKHTVVILHQRITSNIKYHFVKSIEKMEKVSGTRSNTHIFNSKYYGKQETDEFEWWLIKISKYQSILSCY